jgi:hypothetical protein
MKKRLSRLGDERVGSFVSVQDITKETWPAQSSGEIEGAKM